LPARGEVGAWDVVAQDAGVGAPGFDLGLGSS
jgi:hypothetical protein